MEDKKALGAPTGPTWALLGPDGAYTDADGDHEVAGRMLDLEFDPADSGILYAAAAGGGLWRTTDGGVTWTSLTEDIAAQPVGGIGVSRDDSDILVIGTGEGTSVEGSFYHGVGILRSTDGGANWATTSLSGSSWPDLGAGLGFHFVEAGTTGVEDVFLAGATDGLYRSTDAGANWSLVASCDSCQFFDAKWKPGSTTTVFAAAGNGAIDTNAADSCGVWRSTDAGATWTYRVGTAQHDAHDIGKTKLAVSPDEPDWIYALFGERGLGLTASHSVLSSRSPFPSVPRRTGL